MRDTKLFMDLLGVASEGHFAKTKKTTSAQIEL